MALNVATLRVGTAVVRAVPYSSLIQIADRAGRGLARLRPSTRTILEQNLARVIGPKNAKAAAIAGVGSYARYWVETLRLPHLSDAQIDRRFTFSNYHHILDTKAAGFGPILVLPHLGQWEWAAAWLSKIDNAPVTAAVERLEPVEVFDWFSALRTSYGVNIVPFGADALGKLSAAVKAQQTICLLSDRDIQGSGIAVRFFGDRTSLPAGPALLSCRTGAPLLPAAVYYRGANVHCEIGAPRWPASTGKFRDRVTEMTKTMATDLETLIRAAPEQWHATSHVWPEAPELRDSPLSDDLT